MVITMAKLRMAHASTHGARKPPGPKHEFSVHPRKQLRARVIDIVYVTPVKLWIPDLGDIREAIVGCTLFTSQLG